LGAERVERGCKVFEPAVAAILAHHEAKSGHTFMRQAADRALTLGYRVVPPGGSGHAKYVRLLLDEQGPGAPVTLYLDGSRLTAGGKDLRAFAASLPGAVPTKRDVQFPLGTVESHVLQAFAAWAASGAPKPGRAPRAAPPTIGGRPTAAPKAKPRPPWENQPLSGYLPPSPNAGGHYVPPPIPVRATAQAAPPRTAESRRQRTLIIAAVCGLLLLLGIALSGGIGASVGLAGLAVVVIGATALVRGEVAWAHILGRGVGGAVLAGGLALCVLGGTLTPTTTGSADLAAPPSPTSPSAKPSPTEVEIAAAEAALAETETRENPVTPDVLVQDPANGILADQAEAAAVESAPPTSALAALAAIEAKGRAPKTGYDRALFGPGWGDTDHNGCDTRNDILGRDLDGDAFKPGTHDCVVLTGGLTDPYSGRVIAFQRGVSTSELVQIDHVVPMSDAWQKGAQGWDAARRLAFANDPLNLLAVDGSLNMAKGDGDAATWLPPNKAYRCAYVARQVAVKVKYGLWMTQAEKDATATVLSSCPNEPLPGGIVAQIPEKVAEPAPAPAPAPAPKPVPAPKPAPAPVPKPAPAPAPAPANTVNPGSFCAPAGATGVTSTGKPMVCRTSDTDSRNRWRSP
jgi:hypothetical protein